MSKVGYFLGGTLLGAVGLGALSFLVSKCAKAPQMDDASLAGEDEAKDVAAPEAEGEGETAAGGDSPAEEVAL